MCTWIDATTAISCQKLSLQYSQVYLSNEPINYWIASYFFCCTFSDQSSQLTNLYAFRSKNIQRVSGEPESYKAANRAPVVVKRVTAAHQIYCTSHCATWAFSNAVQLTAIWTMDTMRQIYTVMCYGAGTLFQYFFPTKWHPAPLVELCWEHCNEVMITVKMCNKSTSVWKSRQNILLLNKLLYIYISAAI